MVSRDDVLGVLTDDDENGPRLDELLAQVEKRKGIVPFVGAGLSAAFGFPQWKQFLLDNAADVRSEVETLITNGEYEEAASSLAKALGPGRFDEVLKQTFGRSLEGDALSGRAVAYLPRLASGPVVTTNFDRVIEWAFRAKERRFEPFQVCFGKGLTDFAGSHQRGDRALIKIHGDAMLPSSRVLTAEEYEKHYGELDKLKHGDLDQPLPQALKRLFQSSVALFVGCSLDTDRTVTVLLSAIKDLPGIEHFAILSRPENDDEFQQKRLRLSTLRVRPLWYPPGGHEAVGTLLEYLSTAMPDIVKSFRIERRAGLTKLVGRERDLQRVRELIAQNRLVTLVGAGGCGKTRLAEEVARGLEVEFESGACLVELARLGPSQSHLLPQVVGQALEVREQAEKPPTDALTGFLENRELLLVLDNCERLRKPCLALIQELLDKCPRLKILATSRITFGGPVEQRYAVPPLSVPDEGVKDPEELMKSGAIELFVELGAKVREKAGDSFAITESNAEHVRGICELVAGIPLALELVASRLCGMTTSEVRESMKEDYFGSITTPEQADPTDRHSAMDATIQWSYDLMTQEQKQLLPRISVFEGGGGRLAIQKVCFVEPSENSGAVSNVVMQLINSSMLTFQSRGGTSRYAMLEPIRQFARLRLQESGREREFENRHSHYFLDLAADARLLGGETATWLNKLAQDHDNFRAALDALKRDDLESAFKLTEALWRFWEVRGYLSEGRAELKTLIDAGKRSGSREYGKLMSRAGMLAYRQGDMHTAEDLFQQALDFEEQQDPRDAERIAECLNDRGIVTTVQGGYVPSLDYYEKSMAIEERLEAEKQLDRRRQKAVLNYNIGWAWYSEGDLAKARSSLKRGRELFLQGENYVEASFPTEKLGLVALKDRRFDEAREFFEASRQWREEHEDRRCIGDSLNGLARVSIFEEQLDGARALLQKSMASRIEVGADRGVAETLDSYVLLAGVEKRWKHAATLAAASDGLRKKINIPRFTVERKDIEAVLDESRKRSGFEAAWARGASIEWKTAADGLKELGDELSGEGDGGDD